MNEAMLKKAKELLQSVADEVAKRGFDVKTNPEDLPESGSFPAHDSWLIRINEDAVPLLIDEKWSGSVWSRGSTGHLEVRCNWVWESGAIGSSIRMKAKTFVRSKNRPAHDGFDVAKIADHLVLWYMTNRLVREASEARKATAASWKIHADQLRARFPDCAASIKSDEKGLHFAFTLGLKQAEAVLVALSGESCRVCSEAIAPREPPICEDCYRKEAADEAS